MAKQNFILQRLLKAQKYNIGENYVINGSKISQLCGYLAIAGHKLHIYIFQKHSNFDDYILQLEINGLWLELN